METHREVRWRVFGGTQLEAETRDEGEALEAFERLVRFDVAQHSPRWTFVHAGAVGWNGRAILIPGASYSGKSRLVEALVRAGATYYSDEYAVLDAQGRVHPFSKPLTLRRESGRVDRVTAGDIGGELGSQPLPVGMVISTRYVPGTTQNLSDVSAGAALVALLTSTVRAQIDPAHVLTTLARTVQEAVTLEGPRGEALEMAEDLLRRASFTPPTIGETA